VAAAAGGPRNPAWYHNLVAHPDKVQIEMAGRKVAVIAEQLHGAEREAAWRQITTAAPRFAEYQQKTDRELRVIRWYPDPAELGSPSARGGCRAAANVRDPGNSD
jgi:deazaflavin-dependent oxidoreductase (nitroreductase family)